MLQLERASVSIGGAEILREVSLHVPRCGFVAVVGRNGAGKTTLCRAALNLLPVSAGSIRIDGRNTTGEAPHRVARLGIGYMPEDRRIVPDWSVERNILLPAEVSGRPDARRELGRILDLIPELAGLAGRRALELSGGQQKLVALARALMAATRLLILDEPFEGVAPVLRQRLSEVLNRIRETRKLAILHLESEAGHVSHATAIYTLDRGTLSRS